jgi:hypothetical protein
MEDAAEPELDDYAMASTSSRRCRVIGRTVEDDEQRAAIVERLCRKRTPAGIETA